MMCCLVVGLCCACDGAGKPSKAAVEFEEENNPIKRIPREYEDALKARQTTLEDAIDEASDEEQEESSWRGPKSWKGPKKWKGPK